MTEPKNFSVVTAFAQSTPKSVEPREEPVEAEAQAVSNWPFNTVRAGPPTPPVYEDQQLNPGPVSFFPYPVRDPNNLPLTFSVVTPLPASLQINPATGEIYGTLDALDWDITTCQVQVSNGFFSVTGPVFRLYYYMTGGDVTKITVYGIEYNVHSFDYDSFQTGDQAFFPVEVGRDVPYFEYLLIGGGGGGGTDRAGGGGGGGVVIGDSSIAIGSYFATVGSGGAAGAAGNDSSFIGVAAVGGGYGGSSASTAVTLNAGGGPPSTGGSGGGGSTTGTIATSISFITGGVSGSAAVNYWVGAAGTTGQGNSGGNGPNIQAWASFGYDPGVYGGAGGGGAGGPGSNPATTQIGGVGGPGIFVKFDGGAGSYVGGGGAGGSRYNNAAGGIGGGGSFAGFPSGTDGTGGGGAGGRAGAGGAGGRGRVVLRYPLYPQPTGVRVFGLVQWLDAANYTSGITWPDNFAGNNATLFNAPSKDAIDGGGCIVFNGTTQYARYNTPAELTALSSFTIETWVKWNTVGSTSSTIQTILDNSWPGSFILQDRPDLGGRLSFEYTQLSGATNLTTSSKVGDGNWHHVAIVGDFRTPDVRIYVDSALAGLVSSPSASNRVIKATTTIGRLESSASRHFNGRMAILRNYARALPYSDILNNFLTEVNRFGTAPEKAYGGVSQLMVIDNVSYIAHTFTSTSFLSGQASFTLSVLSPISAEYTVVGGGGGGGANGGGGGGAGGLRTGTLALSAGSYPVTIGAGGSGGTAFVAGSNGYNTSLASVVATGGGGGASRDGGNNAGSGGSGGGGAGAISASRAVGGTGTAGQGFNGGDGTANLDINSAGGGGGGSAAAGTNAANLLGGVGGVGSVSSISGIKVYLAGGGGGGAIQSGVAGSGGAGGGGSGSTATATAGTAATGSGGGGGGSAGGAGGSGITIIRYPTGSSSPVVDPNSANAVALLPGLGYANSTLSNWTDFSPTPRTYSPTNVVNFDGTGDYLTVPGTANFAFGTGDFTLEGWVYPTGSGATRIFYDARPLGGSGAYPTVYLNGSNQISYFQSSADRIVSPVIPSNTWNHFALVRSGTSGADPFGTFVSLLLHFDGSNGSTVFSDSSANSVAVTANGNAQISTAQSKFGGTSGLFDGSGDYLSWAGTSFASTDDFTVECWVYKTAVDASGYTILFYGTGNTQFSIDNGAAGSIALVINASLVIAGSGTAVTIGSWHHLAWTRQGTTVRAFVNGVLIGSGTSNAAFSISEISRYGASPFGYELNGYLDEVRISKGVARYTANFAVPNAPFPDPPRVTTTLFVNGQPVGFYADTTNYLSGSPVVIGGNSNANSNHWSGSLSNFRVTKGVARYEPTYTQPAAEFPDRASATAGDANYGNTIFLLRPAGPNENTVFSDRSKSAYNVVRNGTPVRSSLAPVPDTGSVSFGAAADFLSVATLPTTVVDSSNNNVSFTNSGAVISALSPFLNTGSLSFNGSTAFVTTPDRADWLFTGDFTIEAWVNPTSILAGGSAIVAHWTNGVATQCSFIFYLFGGNRLGFSWGIGATNTGFQSTTTTVPLNTWTHVAVTRSGSTVRLFVNGVLDATTGTASGSLNDAPGELQIGRVTAADGGYFAGNISNLRITKGVARYTSTFSVPVASFPASSSDPNFASVGLLMLMESGANQLVFPSDFTMETWVYLTATGPRSGTDDGFGGAAVFSCTNGGGAATVLTYFNIGTYRATLNGPITAWSFTYNVTGTQPGAFLIGSSAPQTNTWTHVAVTRSGTTLRLFVNGTLEATATVSGTIGNATYSPRIGSLDYTYTRNLQGFVSDTRVTKGVARYTATFTRPTVSFPTSAAATAADPYYSTNVLLLRGTGVTGGTNFVDFGPNALAVTPVGNAQISAAQSKWGGSSMFFDGNGDRLSLGTNAALFGFGVDDFTIECWFYIAGNSPLSASNARVATLCSCYPTSGTTTGYNFYIAGNSATTGTGIGFESLQANTNSSVGANVTVTQGVWHHAAVSRRGTQTRLFLDGVCVAITTLGNQTVSAPNPLLIGATQFTGYTYDLNGYIDDFRISKVARYTANFVPPQRYNTGGADPNFANVSLLLPLNEPVGVRTFADSSTNAVTVTTAGDTVAGTRSVGAWSRNAPKAYGGAVYFDGTANVVRTLDLAQALVTGDFTMECWFNSNSSSAVNKIIFLGSDYGVTGKSSIGVVINGTELRVLRAVAGTAATIMTTTGVSTGGWNHLALVRSGTSLYMFVNGTNTAVAYDATAYYDTNYTIGWYSAGNYFIGYMQDVRIYHGAAKYMNADANFGLVSLLLHGDGTNGSTTITNNAVSTLTVTAQGNAQISTAQSKWGGSSIAFDGNADYLSLSTALSFAATDDFTVECWIYKTAVDPSGYTVLFYGAGGTQFNFDAVNIGSIGLAINNTTVVASASTGTSVTSNTWHHLAWTRQGTTVRAFVNGVLMGSGTSNAAFSLSEIGRFGQTPFGYEMNGYIDDIRITKGLARYTANFTPPAAAFPDAPSFAPPAPLAT